MKIYIIAATICLGVSSAYGDDAAKASGKELHENNCVSCHKPELYTKPNRRVTSREKLSSQVRFCVQQLNLPWFDEETESVAEYLNKEFYNFK